MDELMDIGETAKYLRLSERTVWKKAKEGILPSHRIKGIDRLLFCRDELRQIVMGSAGVVVKSKRGPKPRLIETK